MKTLIKLSVAAIFFFTAFAKAQSTQTCNCKEELDYLVSIMPKMDSYKRQVKKNKEAYFNELYTTLSNKISTEMSILDCYTLLQKQLRFLNDGHANIISNAQFIDNTILDTPEALVGYRNSEDYKNYPRSTFDLDVLITTIASNDINALEGLYNWREDMRIAIVQVAEGSYEAVVLESTDSLWERGMIKAYITDNGKGKYDVIGIDTQTFKPQYVANFSFENGRIWSFKKEGSTNNFEFDIPTDEKWYFEQLSDETQYVRFASFSAYSTKNRNAAKKFLNDYKKKFTAKNIIVDLRSNGGGSAYLSDKFIKPLTKNGAKLYVLTNMFTASNAEQFTDKLVQKGATHIGQTTWGTIAYGSDNAGDFTSPSGLFTIYVTNMDFHDDYIQYEGKGIPPGIKLDFKSDWMEQTEAIIAGQKP